MSENVKFEGQQMTKDLHQGPATLMTSLAEISAVLHTRTHFAITNGFVRI